MRSYVNLDSKAVYVSTILPPVDGGKLPRFQVLANDDPDNPVIEESSSHAWKAVYRRVIDARVKSGEDVKSMCSVSGPAQFGFAEPTIAKLIQELPNADLCQNYVMKEFLLPGEVASVGGEENTDTSNAKAESTEDEPASKTRAAGDFLTPIEL